MRRACRVAAMMGMTMSVGTTGCMSSEPLPTTGQFTLTGTASLRGTVLDSLGVPRDSMQVMVDITDNGALYGVQPAVTAGDGRFTVLIERRGGVSTGDSIRAMVNASSLRLRDRAADGTSLVSRTAVWVYFATPPKLPVPQELALVVSRAK